MVRSVIVGLCLVTLFFGPVARANLLLNPSFEAGITSPVHWNAWGNGDFIIQTGGARTGDRCMNLGGDAFALMYQRVPATAGEGYTCRVWASYDSGQGAGQLKLEFHDAFEVKIMEQILDLYPSPTWEEYAITGVAPPGTSFVTATIVGLEDSTVLFDDVSLIMRTEDPELLIDIQSASHTFDGFGVQAWDASADTGRVYDELNIRYARVSSASAAVFAAGKGVDAVYLRWSAPTEYTDANNELQAEYVDDYAILWANTVASLAGGGMTPAFIELGNEPDGHWNTYISPANYSALVKLTRAELDTRGLFGVGIVGPSLTHLNWGNHNSTWIGALDTIGVQSLTTWGSHSWDDGKICIDGSECIEANWPEFGASADLRDPLIPKFITEFATSENVFHGVVYPHPDDARDYSATNSMSYAVRVYENTLALLNSGANVPFIWQATDQAWETKGWGLIDLAGNPKPVYHALRTLLPNVPIGASVVDLGEQSGNIVYAAAFTSDSRLVIGLANDRPGMWQKRMRILGDVGVQIVEATACVIDHQGDPATEDPDTAQVIERSLVVEPDNRITVDLPGDSTLIIVCDVTYPEGDLDHNAVVNLEDYFVLEGCLSGPGVVTPPPGCSPTQFDRANLDEDGDVDLGDFARFARLVAE